MKAQKIFAFATVVLAETIIIILNILFGKKLPDNVVVLNIIVCTLAFDCFTWPVFSKWDLSDSKSGKWVGTLFMNLRGTSLYATSAIAAMFIMNSHAIVCSFSETYPVAIKYQLLVHGILLLSLISTFFFSSGAGSQIENVATKEAQMKSGLDDMKSAVRRLQDTIFTCQEVSPEVRRLVDEIQADIRYLSPMNSLEAQEIEADFIAKVNALLPAFDNYTMNKDSINKNIALLSHIVNNRKQLYN